MPVSCCPNCGVSLRSRFVPLTQRQHDFFLFLAGYIGRHGYAPSFEEIAAEFGLRSLASVHEHLVNLERKGYIARVYNESRGVTLLVTPDEIAPVAEYVAA